MGLLTEEPPGETRRRRWFTNGYFMLKGFTVCYINGCFVNGCFMLNGSTVCYFVYYATWAYLYFMYYATWALS